MMGINIFMLIRDIILKIVNNFTELYFFIFSGLIKSIMEEENQMEDTEYDHEYWLSYIGEPQIEISI